MKTILGLAITSVTATGAVQLSVSRGWAAGLDARPEALMIGATLLLAAALIRYGTAQNRIK